MEFVLKSQNEIVSFYYEDEAFSGVNKIADEVREDVFRVTGTKPKKVDSLADIGKIGVCFATVGKSSLLDRLVEDGLIDISNIKGKREDYSGDKEKRRNAFQYGIRKQSACRAYRQGTRKTRREQRFA